MRVESLSTSRRRRNTSPQLGSAVRGLIRFACIWLSGSLFVPSFRSYSFLASLVLSFSLYDYVLSLLVFNSCLPVFLCVCLSACLGGCLPVRPPVCLPASLFLLCLSVYLSICVCPCLASVCLLVRLMAHRLACLLGLLGLPACLIVFLSACPPARSHVRPARVPGCARACPPTRRPACTLASSDSGCHRRPKRTSSCCQARLTLVSESRSAGGKDTVLLHAYIKLLSK